MPLAVPLGGRLLLFLLPLLSRQLGSILEVFELRAVAELDGIGVRSLEARALCLGFPLLLLELLTADAEASTRSEARN